MIGAIVTGPADAERVVTDARIVRQALRELASEAQAAGGFVEALAFERAAEDGTDARLARLARFLR